MAVKITDDCIACGACEAECPNKAIKEGSTSYTVNASLCTECVGSHRTQQCIEICPVSAVVLDDASREPREVLLERWRKLHPGQEPKN
jgi:ferredoxin